MPIYDYKCIDCGSTFEQYNSIAEMDHGECPACGSKMCKRQVTHCAVIPKDCPGYDMKFSRNLAENTKAMYNEKKGKGWR